jgi:hypothetical protein
MGRAGALEGADLEDEFLGGHRDPLDDPHFLSQTLTSKGSGDFDTDVSVLRARTAAIAMLAVERIVETAAAII